MPEGVEVKLSADLIRPLVVGKIIKGAYSTSNSRYGDSRDGSRLLGPEYNRFMDGWATVESVDTKGKFMYWTLSDKWCLMNTFGMTGQWSPIVGKHPCFVIEFEDDSKIYFNDPRHFGTIQISWNPQALIDKLNALGWDPLKVGMDEKWINYVNNKLDRLAKPIGQVLMDQGIFAGVGNYIRAEALYLAKMSPWRQANLVKKDEIVSLCQAIVNVMNDSYAHQGATILTYKDAYGAEGKYSSCFKVYGHKKDPLGNPIVKENTPDKRTIHWCPAVQV